MVKLKRGLPRMVMIAPLLVGAVAFAPPASAGQGQGIIEVDGQAFDTDPGNEPHVGCVFQVDFKNYDEGDTFADVTFELQPPTTEPENRMRVRGDIRPFIGDDPAGGQDDVDAQERYVLSFSGPPAKQGYHVKLTIKAEGTNRADKRFKVYYVQCARRFQPPAPPPPSPQPPPSNPGPPPVVPTVINGGAAGNVADNGGVTNAPADGIPFGVLAGLVAALTVATAGVAAAAGSRRHVRNGS